MRMHIILEDRLVKRMDKVVGPRGRAPFIREAIERALDQQSRIAAFEKFMGSIPDHGHDWDEDPAKWVHDQRFSDPRRVGSGDDPS